MMTLEEIQNAAVNPIIAREAYDQAALRLTDILDTKKSYEQKAFTLFSGYLTVTLALLGVGGAILNKGGSIYLVIAFWVTAAVFALGAIYFVAALLDAKYGAVASDPDMWLNYGTIDGPDAMLGLMLAYIAFHHQERINKSIGSNQTKARRIRRGILLGISGPFVLCFLLALPAVWSKAFF